MGATCTITEKHNVFNLDKTSNICFYHLVSPIDSNAQDFDLLFKSESIKLHWRPSQLRQPEPKRPWILRIVIKT